MSEEINNLNFREQEVSSYFNFLCSIEQMSVPDDHPEIKAPYIDFNRIGTSKPPQLEIRAEIKVEVTELVVTLLGEHYTRISAILGLDLVEDNYQLSVDELKESRSGEHQKPIGRLIRGNIRISRNSFEAACLQLLKPNQGEDTEQIPQTISYTAILGVIETLAHELYHKRQATFFSRFYDSRMANFTNPEDDIVKYRNQIIEIGARAFAKRYMQHLKDELNEQDKSDWATSVRRYRSVEDLFKIDFDLIQKDIPPCYDLIINFGKLDYRDLLQKTIE